MNTLILKGGIVGFLSAVILASSAFLLGSAHAQVVTNVNTNTNGAAIINGYGGYWGNGYGGSWGGGYNWNPLYRWCWNLVSMPWAAYYYPQWYYQCLQILGYGGYGGWY